MYIKYIGSINPFSVPMPMFADKSPGEKGDLNTQTPFLADPIPQCSRVWRSFFRRKSVWSTLCPWSAQCFACYIPIQFENWNPKNIKKLQDSKSTLIFAEPFRCLDPVSSWIFRVKSQFSMLQSPSFIGKSPVLCEANIARNVLLRSCEIMEKITTLMPQPPHFLEFVPFQYPQSSTKPSVINCIHI